MEAIRNALRRVGIAFVGAALLVLAGGASALPCLDTSTQPSAVDWSAGTARIQIPTCRSDGSEYATSESITCVVTNSGVTITAIGAPGEVKNIPVPAGEYGNHDVTGRCEVGGLMGGATTVVTATFPGEPGPQAPLLP